MPYLHLPNDHTDADLVLAADVAEAVSSADLYVTWTLDAGAGPPEVEAVVRGKEPADTPANPFAALVRGIAAVWGRLTGAPAGRPARSRPAAGHGRRAGEPSL